MFLAIKLQLMLVEASLVKDQILRKITTPQGNFYFFEDYIISEFNEGVTVTYNLVAPIIKLAKSFYGEYANVAYISNRVNSFSVSPTDWLHFYKQRNTIASMAVVAHTKLGLSNVLLESFFVKCKMKKFTTLEMAVSWSKNNVIHKNDRVTNDLQQIA